MRLSLWAMSRWSGISDGKKMRATKIGLATLIAADSFIAKVITPLNRLLGFTLLGNGTVRALQRGSGSGGSNGGLGFF